MNVLVDTFVPVELVGELKENLSTIQKRAKRIHFPEPTAEYLEVVTGTSFGHDRTPATADELDAYRQKGEFDKARQFAAIDWQHVIISGEPLKLNGWSLIASIDGVEQKDGTVLAYFRPAGAQEIPEAYRMADPYVCDHCGLRRWRTETFLVGHEDGSFKQVGRQCIRDFLGWSPDALVPFLHLFSNFMDDIVERDWGAKVVPSYSPEEVLKAASRIVAKDGFYQSVAKKMAAEIAEDHENMWSTKDRVIELMEPPFNARHRREFHDVYNDEQFDDSANRIYLETLVGIDELKKQDAKSEWAWSLETAFGAKYLKRHQLGVIASAVILGLKRIQAETERKEIAKGPESQYVGQIGEKWATTVTVTNVRFVDSGFGSSSLIEMVDDNGNVIKTFYSGSKSDPAIDQRINITGTIKKHEEYKGRRSTVLTRYSWVNA